VACPYRRDLLVNCDRVRNSRNDATASIQGSLRRKASETPMIRFLERGHIRTSYSKACVPAWWKVRFEVPMISREHTTRGRTKLIYRLSLIVRIIVCT
jgi:hypothetical protein